MTDDSEHPYGPGTGKFRAVFVPDDSDGRASGDSLRAELGFHPLKLPAVIVPDGASGPGSPYTRIGSAQFRPDQPAGERPIFTQWQTRRPSQPAGEASASGDERPRPPPPTPAAAYPSNDPLSVGLAAWRGLALAGSLVRRRLAKAAAPPPADQPGAAESGEIPRH